MWKQTDRDVYTNVNMCCGTQDQPINGVPLNGEAAERAQTQRMAEQRKLLFHRFVTKKVYSCRLLRYIQARNNLEVVKIDYFNRAWL